MPDNTLSTLEQVRVKIRRLTKTPSQAQMSDANIDEYINNFLLYDFPEHLRTFTLRTTLDFYTQPFIEKYSGDEIADNFINKYTKVYENNYICGKKAFFTQSREEFFNLYTKKENKKIINLWDGVKNN